VIEWVRLLRLEKDYNLTKMSIAFEVMDIFLL
jgi:hypothetical protein